MKHLAIFFIALFLFSNINLLAQSPFIQQITTSDGLPSNLVHKVFQDSKKFLWFATDAGVARYDGSKYDYFRKLEGLSSNDVVDIKEDSYGRIWFIHKNGLLDFFKDNSIYNKKNTPFLDSLKSNDHFMKIEQDPNGDIYFYQHSQLLVYQLTPRNQVIKYKLFSIPENTNSIPRRIQGMSVRCLYRNNQNKFIMWSLAGCYSTDKLSEYPTRINSSLNFRDVITSSDNKKYVLTRSTDNLNKDSTKYSIKRFNYEVEFDSIKPMVSLISSYIYSILEDRSGLLWISTLDHGVYCFRDRKEIYHLDIKDAKSVIQDHDNNIWIGSLKDGVYKISPYFMSQQHFGTSLFDHSGIYALCPYDSVRTWFTNGKRLYLLDRGQFYKLEFQKAENSINQIIQINPGTILTGETSKYQYALKGIRIDKASKKISYDEIVRSKITMNKVIYNKRKNQINSFTMNYVVFVDSIAYFTKNRIRPIYGNLIYNTYFNSEDELVVNSNTNFTIRDNKKKVFEELSYFNQKPIIDHLNLPGKIELFNIEGDSLFLLKNKKLYNLSAAFEQPIDLQIKRFAYKDSVLYIATARNLFICNKPLNAIEGKQVITNIININFRSIHDLLINNDSLYIASDEGLSAIPLEVILRQPVYESKPYIQSLKVNDTVFPIDNNPTTLKTNQRINITFGCINFSISPIIFSYRLEGTADDWTVVKGNNVVLQNLPKGKYFFEFRARKPGSRWSESIKIGIVVTATIWQHPLLYFALILILAGIAVMLVLKRKNQELKRRLMENQIIQLEQKSLQAMMNPHFIFNTLGSIQNYLLHNKPYEAGIYLSKFARLIRQNFNALDTPTINLEEEVDRLKNYLELERLRTTEKFDYSIVMDESLESDDILIPSMIIQPFAENAVWHGIANLEGKGEILISISQIDEKSLKIVVSDTGIGIKNAAKFSTKSDQHLQLGMNITWKRLTLLSQKYKVKTDVSFTENIPESDNPGVKVTIIVPFIYGKSGGTH